MRDQVIIDVVSIHDVGRILDPFMLRRLWLAERKGHKITCMFSHAIVDIRNREELHACTGWLTEHFVPWNGIRMRDKGDQKYGFTVEEIKLAWVRDFNRNTIARLYDFDTKFDQVWKREGFVLAQDHLYDIQGHDVSTCPVWIPEEAVAEQAAKQWHQGA